MPAKSMCAHLFTHMHMHEVCHAKAPAALPVAEMLFEILTEQNTQVRARGIFYFKHSQTLTVQRGSKLLPLQHTFICHLYLL